jgi:cysteine-rich repeat protein
VSARSSARLDPFVPARALVRPAFLGALALLVANDHLFKGSGLLPGWLTGKLSDVAGLFVAPVLLAWIFRARTRSALFVVHLVVGVGFTAFELSTSLADAADVVYRLAGFAWRQTSDPTDLLALFVLPISLRFCASAALRADEVARLRWDKPLAALSLLACVASTGGKAKQSPPCTGPDCDGDGVPVDSDCNDDDPTLRPGMGCPLPGAESVCDDLLDDDHDGLVDCEDPDCALACADLQAACSATVPIDLETTTILEGSTVVGTSVTDGSCVGADAPEVMFPGAIVHPGTLTVSVPPGHGVHVRRDCDDRFTELACSTTKGSTLEVPITTPGPVTVVVEALDPLAPSSFAATVAFQPEGCGDGAREAPEECDDGNVLDGDGCSAKCTVEWASLCPALPVLAPSAAGTFDGAVDLLVDPCTPMVSRVERAFAYVPTSTSVTFTASSSADLALFVTEGCGEAVPVVGCVDATLTGAEALSVKATPGVPLTVVVELAPSGAPADAFTLDATEP